jgi:hypothetical protein
MTPRRIVDRLELVVGVDGAPRSLTLAIEVELRAHFGLLAIQAVERAERVAPAVARIVADRAANSEQAGTLPILVLLGSTADFIAGCCYVLPLDTVVVAAAKQHRLQVGSLHDAMRALTFGEFEKFGARVLAEIGATFYHITPHSGDEGIDFYGHLNLGQYQAMPAPFAKLAHDVVLLFAGQAKHYPIQQLGPDVVRELIGAISLARTKTFSRESVDIFRGFELKPFSALIILLFTTGGITSGAVRLAESAGIIARTGEQLAVFLADKGVGMVWTATGAAFDQSEFTKWLNV